MHQAQVINLAQLLVQTARLHPQRPGVIRGDTSWNWREIDARTSAMAKALSDQGVRPGDRILSHSRNILQTFELGWVAWRMGCVWVPTNFRLMPNEVAYLGESSGATVMIYEQGFEAHAQAVAQSSPALRLRVVIRESERALDAGELDYEQMVQAHLDAMLALPPGAGFEPVPVHQDTPAWFFYTSGTTGKPKAAVLTHGQMTFVVTNHLADLIPQTTEEDCSIVVAPLSHGAGVHAMLNVARAAASVLMPGEKLDPEVFWQLVEKHRVSNLFTVPTIVKVLVEHPAVDQYDHSSLRYMIYAGAPMYRTDQKLALQKLGKVLVQYFGLGEVTGCITVLPRHMHSEHDDDPNASIGSCGRPRTGIDVAILDSQMRRVPTGEIGEICVRGPAVFEGYFGNDEATAKALRGDWFHTGDLGRMDERGLLYITGRESDMYISGGSNVYPREVEEILLEHPDILEVAVLGVPDPKWGEVGVAVVVLRDQSLTIAPDALYAHLEGRCAKYRWPRSFFFWEALPKSGYGKITKKDVRQQLIERGEIQA
ncbi:acyl-CoA synthetase [Orrella marina]|uniref:Acyl-CoA synthetase n=1 Tax=Orrella marina TaxID=2163011 RepID=A0A2R4XP77_9BURK|nr:acyl-CoA synthetase [Orrella marina]AWB35612.1 acyl-CoA synthetase [Orrella marina]